MLKLKIYINAPSLVLYKIDSLPLCDAVFRIVLAHQNREKFFLQFNYFREMLRPPGSLCLCCVKACSLNMKQGEGQHFGETVSSLFSSKITLVLPSW